MARKGKRVWRSGESSDAGVMSGHLKASAAASVGAINIHTAYNDDRRAIPRKVRMKIRASCSAYATMSITTSGAKRWNLRRNPIRFFRSPR